MQLLKRFGYFFIGLALGSIAVIFFWKKKKVTFDYGMDARTLKTIRIRERFFSDEAKNAMNIYKIDSSNISDILRSGDVDFSKSQPRQRPCAEYYITSDIADLYVSRCENSSTIEKVIVKQQ